MTISREKLFVLFVLVLVLGFQAVALWPEIQITRIDLNDNVFHYTLIERVAQAIQSGENPLDCWSPEWSFGFPVVRVYQPLAHWLVVGIWLLLAKSVPLMTVFIAVRFLSVALLPLTFFAAARGLGLTRLAAAAAALLAPLISTNFLYGVENGSFTWAGSGLFPQAVATHLFLLSLAAGCRAIREGRRTVLAGALVGLTLLSHLIYGYMAALSLCLLAAFPVGNIRWPDRFLRLTAIGLSAFVLSAFQLIPMLRDASLINHSRWEPVWKWDSFGAAPVLKQLFQGDLLDFGRLPVLSLLALAGIFLYLWDLRRKNLEKSHSYLCAGATLWILIFFGRSFWGSLLTVLGISEDMHLHRVIGGAHVFLVLLAAIALSRLWTELAARRQVVIAAAATALLLYPLAADRWTNLRRNAIWGRKNLERHAAEQRDVDAAVASAKSRGGRAYAGLAATWGGQFKVGDIPFYAHLSTAQVPSLSFLYHSMALTGDLMVRFIDQWPVQYRLFNVTTLITPDAAIFAPPGMLTPRAQFGRFYVHDAPGGGYFDIVDADTAVKVTRRSFYDINDRWLRSDLPGKRAHLLLEFRDPAPPGMPRIAADGALPVLAAPAPDPGRVAGEREIGPQVFTADTDTLRPAYALFKMTWHPNWHAYVDGARQPVVMLSPGFSGVALSPGRHRIEFRYEPGPWKPILAVLGLLLVAIAAWRETDIGSRLRSVNLQKAASKRAAVAAGLVLLTLPVAVPLFSSSVLWGHDAFEYFPRIVEVRRNLEHGIILPRWAPDFGRGAGQPLFIFHPPLFYWIGTAWNLLGINAVTAVNLAAAVVVFASAAGMFLLGRLYFGRTGGWLAATAYLYAPYFAVDLYVRSAMEEFTAFPLIAFSLYGFGVFARKRSIPGWLLGAASFAAILCAHFPAALLFAPLLLSFLALTAWIARSWRVAAMQAGGFALALSLSAWSWAPAIVERQYVALNRTLEGHLRFTNHFVSFQQLIYSPWGYGLSVPGGGDGMSFSLGWTHLLLAVTAAVWAARSDAPRPLVRFAGGAVIALCLLMSAESLWLWENLPLLAYVEYPWRILQPAAVCLALLIGALGMSLDRLARFRKTAIAAAMALLVVPGFARLAPGRTADVDLALWSPARMAATGFESTTAGEITPRWTELAPPAGARVATVASGDAEIVERAATPFEWMGTVRAKSPSVVQIARAYYPGWKVLVDAAPAQLTPAPMTGLLQFPVPPGDHEVEVTWERSPARRAGEAISLVGILAAAFVFRRRTRAPSITPSEPRP